MFLFYFVEQALNETTKYDKENFLKNSNNTSPHKSFNFNSSMIDNRSDEAKTMNSSTKTIHKNSTEKDNDCLNNTEDAWSPREIDSKQSCKSNAPRRPSIWPKNSI